MNMKICNTCKIEKEETDFYLRYSVPGRKNSCKKCANTQRTFDIASNMATSATSRSKKKGRSEKVSKQDILDLKKKQNNRCALTGWEMDWVPTHDGKRTCPPLRASIDRIDSSKGYEKGNIQLVCDIANRVKSAYPQELFIDMCRAVTEFHNPVKRADTL